MDNQLIRLVDAARQLKIGRVTLHRYVKDGRIPFMRLGNHVVFAAQSLPQIQQVYKDSLSQRAKNGSKNKKDGKPSFEARLSAIEQKVDQLLALWSVAPEATQQ